MIGNTQKFLFTIIPVSLVALVLILDTGRDQELSGTIVSTSFNQLTLHDLSTGEYQQVIVDSNTEVRLNGEVISLEYLRPFDQANIVASREGEAWLANTIDVYAVQTLANWDASCNESPA